MVGEPVVIAEPSFLEGESSPAVLERFVSQSRNGLRGSRKKRFWCGSSAAGKLGPRNRGGGQFLPLPAPGSAYWLRTARPRPRSKAHHQRRQTDHRDRKS